jgi:hypothetical protein
MWKWLRSWFAWRFSLRRLVIATVVLGTILGLNLREIGPLYKPDNSPSDCFVTFWGWPLPYIAEPVRPKTEEPVFICDRVPTAEEETKRRQYFIEHWDIYALTLKYELPLTHKPFYILEWPSAEWLMSGNGSVICGTINVLVLIGTAFLILFLQIPRRKAPEQVESAHAAPSRR